MSNNDDDVAMEGRAHSADGADLGDTAFHEVAYSFDSNNEFAALDAMDKVVNDLEITQAIALAVENPDFARVIYQQLLERFPTHKEAAYWQSQLG